MSALIYIVRKSAKNNFKELLRKPGKLILYILVTAALIAVIVLSILVKNQRDSYAPLFWLTGILFLFTALFVIISIAKGLSGGDTIFEMNDVNLTFVSPLSSRSILLYGIVRMVKTAFFGSFFIFFQASSFANFGVGYGGVLLTFAGFLLSIISLTLVSLVIYSAANGSGRRKMIVKCVAVALFLPLAFFIAAQYLRTQNIVMSLETAIKSPFLSYIPVAGWLAGGVTAFVSGDLLAGFFFFGLNLLLGAALIIYILLSNPDYYEDVLVATETAYEKKRAISEGNIGAASNSQRKVKVSKTGISGSGAAALFGKHMRENLRQSRLGAFPMSSIFVVIGAVIMTAIIRDLMIVMQILMWVQILLIGTGRGLKETYSHYIYLIPESSFKKILWSNMEIMARTAAESVLLFGVGGFIIKEHLVYIFICILVYVFFSLLLLGVNYLSMRFTGADISAGILIVIYYFTVVLVMTPGVILAIVIGIAIGGDMGTLAGLLVLSGWELVAALGCFALSKGVLHSCDMAVIKMNK